MAGKPLFSQAGCLVYEIWTHIVFTPMKTHFIACSLAGLCLSCFGQYGFGQSFDAIDLQVALDAFDIDGDAFFARHHAERLLAL